MSLPKLWINGSELGRLSAQDRGFRYGDGVFETFRIHCGRIHLWQYHLDRLQRGLDALGIALTEDRIAAELAAALDDLQVNGIEEAAGRLQVTRGDSPHGYRAPSGQPPITISLTEVRRWRAPATATALYLCQTRLATQPALAGLKHCNRLEQVLAAQELNALNFQGEGIQLNGAGNIACGVSSNLFLVTDDSFITPALTACGIEGTVRRLLLEVLLPGRGLEVQVRDVTSAELLSADEVLLTNALSGIRNAGACQVAGVNAAFTCTKWGDTLRRDFYDWCEREE